MKAGELRVIHSYPVWLPQTQTWMHNQVKYLPKAIEVHVVCYVTAHLEQFKVPNIHSLKDISRLHLYAERILRKLSIRTRRGFLTSVAKEIDAHIIHSHFGTNGWLNQISVQALRAKHVVTYYGYDVNMVPTEDKKWVSRYQELFAHSDVILCEGPHMARELIRLGCPQAKVKVHHLGVETDIIPYVPRKWTIGSPLRVMIAATFQEKKGIPHALQALAHIQQDVPLEITILGDATRERRSQREKQRIMEIIRKSRLASKTNFLGYQPYSVLFREAYKHHVFISPSVTASNGDTEGGAPVTLIEMMATGMPVISTTHCDIPEVVQYGIDDWLVEERNVWGLVSKLRWLIERPGNWDDLLQTGRTHIEKNFNAYEQGRKLAKIYQDLLASCD